jgi:NAD(P)-dependent dehydrogenase (short-subunit alcohol dehydrogenase family)
MNCRKRLGKKFPDKRVIITGAGSGLGRAMALEFAEMGWKVAVAEKNRKRAGETIKEINGMGGTGMDISCDVTRPADLEKCAKILKERWGGVDILINNAGVAAAGFMEKISLEQWEWIIDLNLKSIIHGCRVFIPVMTEQGGGHIVNVASNAGIASLPEMSCYNVTKAAAISMSETLRIELTPRNIGVTAVCPTFFKTNLMEQFRSPDTRQQHLVNKFFEKSRTSAEKIARHTIKSIARNRFYVITQGDGKLAWRGKRFFPELYFKVASVIYKRGFMEKYLDMKN